MPSTLVHVALAGLVGTALLGRAFSRRAILLVLAVAVVPDLDAFVGPHRALGHTFLLPALLVGLLVVDLRVLGEESLVRRYGGRFGPRVAGVALVGLFVGGILPDLFTNGVNVFYPIHDAFYRVNGELLVSNQRGVVQTFVELGRGPVGTTESVHYATGVDPTPGEEPENVERVFYVLQSGTDLLLVLAGFGVVAGRLYETRADADGRPIDRRAAADGSGNSGSAVVTDGTVEREPGRARERSGGSVKSDPAHGRGVDGGETDGKDETGVDGGEGR
jgi:hypothetical protein